MPTKIKANGKSMCLFTTDELRDLHEKGGKQGHKARMELTKRGLLNGQGKNLFELVADTDVTTVEDAPMPNVPAATAE